MGRKVKAPKLPSPVVRWAHWAEGRRLGQWFKLERGRDFHQDAIRASRAARQWASNNGFGIHTKQGDDDTSFKLSFYKLEPVKRTPGRRR